VDDQPTCPATAERPESPRARLLEAALLAALALTINLVGNGRTSLWDRDEPRYAGCTREMRASGDYVHPTFNAEPRYHKPVLTYWLMLAGTAVGGDNEFGSRLVSALMGTGTVLLVWTLGRRMFGRRVGRLAALVLATAPIMAAESKLATTDATLMFFLVACLLALWELARAPSGRWAALFWVALSLATLTKGPVGPAFLGVAGVVSWAWGGPTACWRRLRWRWGVPGFVLLTAPWYVAIGLISHGEFYRVSMGQHVIHRMTTGMETHGGFPGYYVAFTLGVFYPWSALLPAALAGAWARRRSDPALGFAAGWTLGPLLMLEVIRTKLIHYYLPAYAGAALLVAWLVAAVAESEINLRRWTLGRMALGLLVGVGLAMAVALMAGAIVIGGGLRWPCAAVSVVVAAGTLFAFERFHGGHPERAAHGLVGSWALALLLVGGWLLPEAEPYRLSPLVAQRLRDLRRAEHAAPMLASFQPPCVVYSYGEPIPTLQTKAWLFDRLGRDGTIASALSDEEIRLLARHPEIVLEPRETLEGFDVERGRVRKLRLTLIRLARPSGPAAPGVARLPEESGVE
jgi:4-amino-4-deoxy-L-arabinose transferase-like glycosyltransferase